MSTLLRQELQKDLIRDEDVKLQMYKCTSGKWTIGIGRNLTDKGITENEAVMLCQNDIDIAFKELDRACPWWITQPSHVRRGLANMCFNLGIDKLLGFKKMLQALKDQDYERAHDEALDSQWADQVGDRADRVASLFLREHLLRKAIDA